MTSWRHFKKNLQYNVYKSASGVTEDSLLDQQAFERLSYLIENHSWGGRYFILAFDSYYKKNGEVDSVKTEFHIPNDYVWKLAQTNLKMEPVVSIHPYRKDALDEVKKWGEKGVRFIKWLPNAMGMDASDSSLIPFYREIKKYNMTILTHVGEEKAVESEEDQKLGNPLRFRLPLDFGVKIIMAHCASLGEDEDFDHPEKIKRSSFDLFERMMDNPKYKELLFADISALMLTNRLGKPLRTVLNRKEWHSRLIQGSDYPIPAINILIRLNPIQKQGYINQKEKEALRELYKVNPLLFDLVLKRFLKHPKTGVKFSEEVFYLPKEFGI
jgi:predicted TIM-barrel fold metal-dependent hydrolase